MEGAARTSGRLTDSFEVGGKRYTLRNPGHLAFMEAAEVLIVSRRPNPLLEAARAIRQLAPGERAEMEPAIREMAESATLRRNVVTGAQIGEFLETRPGIIFTLWQFCEEIETLDQAADLFKAMAAEIGEQAATEELQSRVDTVAGMVEAKNSSGPARRSSGRGKRRRGSNSRAGRRSTSTSPRSTGSTGTK